MALFIKQDLQSHPMISIISKSVFEHQHSMTHQGVSKFLQMALMHDGSMSVMIQCLSQERVKAQVLKQVEVSVQDVVANTLSGKIGLKSERMLLRQSIIGSESRPACIFARSYWDIAAYKKIMSANPQGAIGLNLIQQEIEQYRKINWIGSASIKTTKGQENVLARQYVIKAFGGVVCEIEEFLTSDFSDLFR